MNTTIPASPPAITRAYVELAAQFEAAAQLEQLTPQQRQCAIFMAKGLSAQEIARHMGIGYKMVEVHLHRARKMLGDIKSVELAVLLAKAGLV